jgi:hypothetical protein
MRPVVVMPEGCSSDSRPCGRPGPLSWDLALLLLLVAFGVSASEIYRVRLGGISLSGFRLAILGSAGLFGYQFLRGTRRVRGVRQLGALVLPVAGCAVAAIRGGLQSGGLTLEMLQNILLGTTVVMLTVQLIDSRRRLAMLAGTLVVATSLQFVLFSAVSLHSLLAKGEPLTDLPFREVIPLPIEPAGHLERGFRFGDFARLALPFSTPPHLAAATTLMGILLLYLPVRRRSLQWGRITLALLLVLVLAGTFSRTGYLMAIVGGALAYLVARRPDPRLVFGLLLSLLVVAGFALVGVGPDKLSERIMSAQSNAHHLSTRMQAVAIWMKDVKTVLFGVGLGDYMLFGDGPHSHSDYTTMLSERGIVGILAWSPLFLAPLWSLIRIRRQSRPAADGRIIDGIIIALGVCLFGGLLYQLLQIVTVWMVLALSYAAWSIVAGGGGRPA